MFDAEWGSAAYVTEAMYSLPVQIDLWDTQWYTCPKVHGYDQLHNEPSPRNIVLRDGRDYNHTVRNPHSISGGK